MQLSSERQGSMAREVDYLDTANSFVLDNEDDEELDADPEYLELEKFSQKHRTLAIAWSPETSLNVFPKTVAFCSAASDHKLRLYNSDLAVNSTVQELRGHTDYINAVAYDPYGEYVVSTSDDHTCRVWSLKELPGQCITNIRLLSPGTCSTINTIPGQCITNIRLLSPGTCSTINTIPGQSITNIRLLSPGMSVACHQSEEGKLLVGEKCGVLSLFNLVSGQAILSFDSNRSPLLSADWSPNTSLYAVAVVAGEIVIWDTTNPSHPLETCPAHVEGSECVKFSPLNHSYIATIGQPKHQLKITHLASPHPILVTNLQLESGHLGLHIAIHVGFVFTLLVGWDE
uniref:Uncharacterized protein n=1 Tax=Timema tahoe TaxID=61484 RepID=A0A7R9IC67_9NEOP|nr:unnamed protein product [Timema tahoe]